MEALLTDHNETGTGKTDIAFIVLKYNPEIFSHSEKVDIRMRQEMLL